MIKIIFFIIIFLFFVGWMIHSFRKNQRYLHGPTKNAVGEELHAEFEAERADFSRRTRKFSQRLERAIRKRAPS